MGFYDWDKMRPEEISDLYKRKVALGENLVVARVEVTGGAVTQMHCHEHEEVVIVLKGAWRFLPVSNIRPKRLKIPLPWTSARRCVSIGSRAKIAFCIRTRISFYGLY